MKNKRLLPETPQQIYDGMRVQKMHPHYQWNNRQPTLQVPQVKSEKKYRQRSIFQSDLFLLVFVVVSLIAFTLPVSAANVTHQLPSGQDLTVNKTFTLSSGGSTPALLWFGAILISLILVILSFLPFPNGEEGLLSIAAWVPIAYSMYAAMRVDVITNAGTVVSSAGVTQVESHTIYAFNTEAIILMMFLAFAIGNTYRIWVSQKKMRDLSHPEPEAFDY